jgi:hypothetical protein
MNGPHTNPYRSNMSMSATTAPPITEQQSSEAAETRLSLYDLESILVEGVEALMEAQELLLDTKAAYDQATTDVDREAAKTAGKLAADAYQQAKSALQVYLTSAAAKRDAVAHYLRHLDNQCDLATDEIRRLQDRKRILSNRAEHLRSYIVGVMEVLKLKKLEGETCTLSLRKNPDSVEVEDVMALPTELRKEEVVYTAKKNEIKAVLKTGEEVNGARLVEGKNRLVIS